MKTNRRFFGSTFVHFCFGAPWRMAATSYAFLPLTLLLSAGAHRGYYEPYLLQLCWNVAYSASCLFGLTLLVLSAASALCALFSLRRDELSAGLENVAVLLLTLPPIVLHVWFILP